MFEVVVGAEYRVNLVIVARVVVVITFRLENGIEINRADSQFLKIIKLCLDAAQVAAKKVVSDNLFGVDIFKVDGIVAPTGMEDCALFRDNLVAFAIKSVRENLIHDGVLEPIGSLCALLIDGNLKCGRQMIIKFADAAEKFAIVAVVISLAAGNDYEIVPEQAAFIGHFHDERIKFLFGLGVLRRQV